MAYPIPQPEKPQYPPHPNLDLVEVYSSRADYQARRGEEAPPYNPARPIKNWADRQYGHAEFKDWPAKAVGLLFVRYPENSLQPEIIAFADTIATVNLPPDGATNVPNVGGTAVPMRELNTFGAHDEVLVTIPSMPGSNTTWVRRTDMPEVPGTEPPAGDSAVLEAIADLKSWLAKALGIPL